MTEAGSQIGALTYIITLSNKDFNVFVVITHLLHSYACPINLGSTVILTGGCSGSDYRTTQRVVEYNETGYLRDLPQLQYHRRNHGCGYYVNQGGTKVHIYVIYIVLSFSRLDIPGRWRPRSYWSACLFDRTSRGDWLSLGLYRRASISSGRNPGGHY